VLKKHFLFLTMFKTLLNILETIIFFFFFLFFKEEKVQKNSIHLLQYTNNSQFNQFNVSLLNKSIIIFYFL